MKHPIDTQVIKEKQTCLLAETRGKMMQTTLFEQRREEGGKKKQQLMGFHQKGVLCSSQNLRRVFAFQWKVVGCQGKAFVTSDQKDSEKKKPTKLQNTTSVMHETSKSTQPHSEGEKKLKKKIYRYIYIYLSQWIRSIEAWRFATGQPDLLLASLGIKV